MASDAPFTLDLSGAPDRAPDEDNVLQLDRTGDPNLAPTPAPDGAGAVIQLDLSDAPDRAPDVLRLPAPPPAKARQDYNLSRKTGVPQDVVERDDGELAREVDAQAVESAVRDAPRTQAVLQDPQVAPAVRDDVSWMTYLETAARNVFGGARLDEIAAQYSAGDAEVKLAGLQYRALTGERLDDASAKEVARLRGELAKVGHDTEYWTGDAARLLPMIAYTLTSGGERGLTYGMASGAFAAAAGQAGPQVLAPEELFTVPAATGAGFAVGFTSAATEAAFKLESGLAYEEFSQLKDERGAPLDPTLARAGALAVGTLNAGLEVLGLSKLAKIIPGGDRLFSAVSRRTVGQLLQRGAFKQALLNAGGAYAVGVGSEVATEVAQEIVNIISGEVIKALDDGEFKTTTVDEVVSRLGDIAAMTARGTAVLGLPAAGVRAGVDYRQGRKVEQQAERAQQYRDELAAILDETGNSKTLAEAPELFEELYQRIVADTDLATVRINPAGVTEFFNAGGFEQDIVALFQEAGVDPAEVERALLLGHDVEVAGEKFARLVSNAEFREGVLANVRESTDAATLAESTVQVENLAAKTDELRARLEVEEADPKAELKRTALDAGAEIRTTITEAINRGMPHIGGVKNAGKNAAIYEALYLTAAEDAIKNGATDVSVETLMPRLVPIFRTVEFAKRNEGLDQVMRDQELMATAREFDVDPEILRPELEAVGGDITQTPRFKEWFGSSPSTRDLETGAPRVFYHGTRSDISQFDPEKIRAVDYDAPFNGFWFSSDPDTSPAMVDPTNVMPVYLSIQNPAPAKVWREVAGEVREDGLVREGARSFDDEVRYRLIDMGYDGVLFDAPVKVDRAAFERDGRVTVTNARGAKIELVKETRPEVKWGEFQEEYEEVVVSLPDGSTETLHGGVSGYTKWVLDKVGGIDNLKADAIRGLDMAGAMAVVAGEARAAEGTINGERYTIKREAREATVTGLRETGRTVETVEMYTDSIGHVTGYESIDDFEAMHSDTTAVVFHPEQIKSVHNRGTFSPNDANILNASAARTAAAPARMEFTDRQLGIVISDHGKNAGRAYVARIDIDTLLDLTNSAESRQTIETDEFKTSNIEPYDEVSMEFDPAEVSQDQSYAIPFIRIDETGRVFGHEGRHRAAALKRAGATTIPIAIEYRPNDAGVGADSTPAAPPQTLIGQFDSTISRPTPQAVQATRDNIDQMRALVGEGSDTPIELRQTRTVDPLDSPGDWQDVTITMPLDNNAEITITAGEAVAQLDEEERAARRLLDCINAS
jgi:hypothetical protein